MPDRRLIAVAAAAVATAVAVLPTAAADPTAQYPTDEHGFTGSAARCDDEQTLVQFGRTSRALVAICISPDGELEYRGVRISDQAGLTMPATRAADGTITAVNDGVTYTVTPQVILVSEGDNVLYRDPWTEYHGPRFPAGTTPSASSAAPAPPASSAAPAPPASSAAPAPSASSAAPAPPASSAAPEPPASSAAPEPSASSGPTSPPTVSTTTVTLTPTKSSSG